MQGHVEGVLWAASERADLGIVGIHHPHRVLFDKFKGKYRLDESLYCDDLAVMLDETWTRLMDGRLPDSVFATTNRLKPDLNPRVDDDATIVLICER